MAGIPFFWMWKVRASGVDWFGPYLMPILASSLWQKNFNLCIQEFQFPMDNLYSHVSHRNPVLLTRYRAPICGHLQLAGPYKKNLWYKRVKGHYSLHSSLSSNNFVPVLFLHIIAFPPCVILVMIHFDVGSQLCARNSSCCHKCFTHIYH